MAIHPCGNLLRPRGYDLPSPAEAGYAKAGGQEPQGFLAKKGEQENCINMAWRISSSVIRGEIDNRQKGRVTGRIWLAGRQEPLELDLQGNPLRDLAGHQLTFENPDPAPGHPVDLNPQQRGIVGDMTASRKVRVLEVPVEEALAMDKIGIKAPEHTANCLYLEWYSDNNGRIVIESAGFLLSITEPAWKMSAQEQKEQCRANASAMERWLVRLTNLSGTVSKESEAGDKHVWTPDDDAPMDEFAWEKFLKASDKRTDRYMELFEQFKNLDDESRDRAIARAMGWSKIESYLEERDKGKMEAETNPAPEDIFIEPPEQEPDPLTEGIDWIRTADGDIRHPLAERAFEMVIGMSHDLKKQELSEKPENKPVQDMLFSAQILGAKLAGALNGLSRDHEPDDGFVVAYLKRALKYLHETIKHCELAQQNHLVPPPVLAHYKRDLFSIREEILRLMKKHRKA